MKEKLKAIRNGDIQQFIPVMNQYINEVYTLVTQSYNTNESENITKKVIITLHSDITKKYLWQNPNKFLTKSITRSLRNFKVNTEFNHENNIIAKAVPQQVIRDIMLDLSRSIKRRGFVGNAVKISTSLAVITTICVIATILTIKISKPDEGQTLYKGHDTPIMIAEQKHVQEYFNFSRSFKESQLVKLGDTGTVIDILGADKRLVKIYSKGKLVGSLNVDYDKEIIGGDLSKGYLVFCSPKKMFKTDIKGNLTAYMAIEGSIEFTSLNGKYIAVSTDDDTFEVIDIDKFIKTKSSDGIIFGVTNNGDLVDVNKSTYSEVVNNSQTLKSILLKDGSVLSLTKEGSVIKFNNDEIIWKNRIDLNDLPGDESMQYGYLLETNDKVHVVFNYSGYKYFQSYDEHGNALLKLDETKKELKEEFSAIYIPPESSEMGEYILIYNDEPGYKRYLSLIDTSDVPMKEVSIDCYAENIVLEVADDSYYIYTDTSDEVAIYQILKNE